MSAEQTIKKLRQQYDQFITDIPAYLTFWKEQLNVSELTFGFDEIEQVKSFYLASYQNEIPSGKSLEFFQSSIEAYFGIAFMNNNGGIWVFSKWKQDEAYGLATIESWGPPGYDWMSLCPNFWRIILERGDLGPASRLFSKREPRNI